MTASVQLLFIDAATLSVLSTCCVVFAQDFTVWFYVLLMCLQCLCFQCFDAVVGRASGL